VATPSNHANFFTSVFSVTQSGSFDANQNYLTAVGSYPGSAGFYGTFDQGGNVWEWNDAVISGSFRGLRGGSWSFFENSSLRSSNRDYLNPDLESNGIGFRVASPRFDPPEACPAVRLRPFAGAVAPWQSLSSYSLTRLPFMTPPEAGKILWIFRRKGMSEPPVLLSKWYEYTKWVISRVDQFPKNQRFILGQRLVDTSLAKRFLTAPPLARTLPA
jgi:hypothetical protein